MVAPVPFVVTLDFSTILLFATVLVLIAAPFVVGTFGDLVGVTFEDATNGFRVGVNFAVAVVFDDDAPSVVLVAGLCDHGNIHLVIAFSSIDHSFQVK